MLRRWSRWCANQDNRARLSAETWRKDATAQYRIQGSGVAPSSLPVPEGGHPQRTAPDTYAARVVKRHTPLRVDFCVFPSARSWYRQSLVCLEKRTNTLLKIVRLFSVEYPSVFRDSTFCPHC